MPPFLTLPAARSPSECENVVALARAAQSIDEEDEYIRCLDLVNESDPHAAAPLGLA